MGMRPSDKDEEREQREARSQHDAAQKKLCVKAVKEWNRLMERRLKPGWSPTIRVALVAEYQWLDLWCPGCRQIKQVDLRTPSQHPQTTLHGLIPKLSCRDCRPSPPLAKLVRLSEHKWESKNAPQVMPKRGWRMPPVLPLGRR